MGGPPGPRPPVRTRSRPRGTPPPAGPPAHARTPRPHRGRARPSGSGVGHALGPKIGRHLLRDEGEVVVDEVRRHWVAFVRPSLEAVLVLALLVAVAVVPVALAGVVLVLALVVALHAGWVALREHRDRFVVTNMRVFRVHGVLTTQLATMPLSRILDITVTKPLTGRLLGFGHFVFESAAQEQGLREIRFVPRPDERDIVIQRVVQRSGLRGPKVG